MEKKELRKQIRERIRLISEAGRKDSSLRLFEAVSTTETWRRAVTVLLYCALPDEIDLQPLFDSAIAQNKRIVLPVAKPDGTLDLRLYEPGKETVKGLFDITEPSAEMPLLEDLTQIELAIIPGRAFTKEGVRMGRGKGYYDRLLPSLKCPKWGVCFACQMVENIDEEEWDVRMNAVFVG